MAMAEHSVLDEMRQVIDEVFRDREVATRRDVYSRASEHINIPAETMARLNELPDRSYRKEELAAEVDRIVREWIEQGEPG
ncbi:hypothetical protein GCM10010106_18640 [Thermopolyspora flexuosa]|nr:hypothetical protein GCM10010106_18640 [Thermopolyspora flexuosa]